jgi:ankyrin repeat protein
MDRVLADGVLFRPREMEHKWALFYHSHEIICVRSWLRQVQVVARVAESGDHVEVSAVRGTFGTEDEEPGFTVRVLDYLLRSHALDTVHPAPLPRGMAKEPGAAAMWCMGMFGSRAWFAAPDEVPWKTPEKPLRTHSLLHIAVARGDTPGVEAQLAAGVPVDLLAADGLAPLHWALAQGDLAIMAFLLDRGSPIDVRSSEGATPLMLAVQDGRLDAVSFLLDHGADIDARDLRGFTALHGAAENGKLEVVRTLCDRGASPTPVAQGHTPRSLAERRGHAEIVSLLGEYGQGPR